MKTLGAIFIVAGTSIGGGMIAMPIASASIGFKYSIFIMMAIWAFMFLTSLIALEINLHFKKGVSVSYASAKYLGKIGTLISAGSLALLFYALLAAYMSGGASILSQTFFLKEHNSFIITALCIVFGGVICARAKAVDIVNRILVLLMIALFILLVLNLFPHIQLPLLAHTPSPSSMELSLVIPLFFTSFGFHGSIPTIVNYVGPNRAKLRLIFLIGSLIPLLVYIIWESVSLGVLSSDQLSNIQNAGDLTLLMSGIIKWPHFPLIVQGFSFLAIFTSFLGVGIGLFDFIEENIKSPSKTLIGFLTFAPPLAFSLFYPEAFITALCYAAIALSILAVIIPSLVALKMQTWKPHQKTGLYLVFLTGLAIIIMDLIHINGGIK